MKNITITALFLMALTTALSADFTLDDLFTSGGTKQDKMSHVDSNNTNSNHSHHCCL